MQAEIDMMYKAKQCAQSLEWRKLNIKTWIKNSTKDKIIEKEM